MVIGEPPLEVGAPQRIATYPGPTSASSTQHGSDGMPVAAAADEAETALVPAPLTALTLKIYEEPFDRPAALTNVRVLKLSEKTVHEVPELLEYSMI